MGFSKNTDELEGQIASKFVRHRRCAQRWWLVVTMESCFLQGGV